jgi:hypothetical protein
MKIYEFNGTLYATRGLVEFLSGGKEFTEREVIERVDG